MKTTWKAEIEEFFKTRTQYWLGGTEEHHETPQSIQTVLLAEFQAGDDRIRNRNINDNCEILMHVAIYVGVSDYYFA